jgi:hypothetical protein
VKSSSEVSVQQDSNDHEHRLGWRCRDHAPHRQCGSGPNHGASSTLCSSTVSGSDEDDTSKDEGPVLSLRRLRQPVCGAPRSRAENHDFLAHPRSRKKTTRQQYRTK